jgi:tripeptide aminopeptidase
MDLIKRFLTYVSYDTTSDEESETTPSSAKQLRLAAYLRDEMEEIGLKEVRLDEFGRVYGVLPPAPGFEDRPKIGLIAHMDTSPAVSGTDIHPSIIRYEGGDIRLNDKVSICRADFPFLDKYLGKEMIVTDGTTLLGADDKAGVAEILCAVEYLIAHPEIPHGRIAVAFTPDEEVGRGADHFDVEGFGCDFAYTVDGGALGELEYENFNAASARFFSHGVDILPGAANNKMMIAALIAAELISMLPQAEAPAHTEGYEGFYHVCDVAGNESEARVNMIIRDHDMTLFEERKAFVIRLQDYLNGKYGEGTVELQLRDSYYNMKEKILPVMYVIERAEKAFRDLGIEPVISPVRGGTDGARLSFMGLPCPNLSACGYNFHGVHECVPVEDMYKMVEVLVKIVTTE